jgi:hypothetical protein
MKSVHVAAIIVAAVIGVAFLFAATYVVYRCLVSPRGYGIAEIKFESSRLWPVIKIVVENNKSAGMTVVAVFVNGSEVTNDPYPYLYPKLPVTIQPNTRVTLQIEAFRWNWSTLGTKYAYNVTLVAEDGTVFTKIKETPYPPL